MNGIDRLLTLGFLVSLTANAGLIYDNGAPDQASGNEMTQWIQAEDFNLANPEILTDIRFWNIEDPAAAGYQGSITWQIYSDSAGMPDTVLFSGTVSPTRLATGLLVSDSFQEYQNDFSVGSISLAAGTYWLGLHNGPLATDTRSEFYWETTSGGPNPVSYGQEDETPFGDGAWFNNSREHAFQLYNVVPEPSTLLGGSVMALAAGLLVWRRRKV